MERRPYLKCLGQPALFSSAGEPTRIRTKKHLALLVYLAVEGRRTHRRDRLAELFWPDVPSPQARHSLATALSILRPRLGPGALAATRDHVVVHDHCVNMDLDRLLAGDVVGTATQEALEVTEFLEGFEIPDSAEFGLWKDRQRAKLLPAVRAALVQLIDRCRRTGDTRQIEQLADTMLALDELSEEAVRAKMEARAFAGDRLTALRIFEEWKGKLSEEVGAQPSDLMEGMAVRLRRRGWERSDLADIPTVRTDQWRDRSFIGRAFEYRALYEAWERTKRGQASHVLVLGDSGVGKSTLVDRLITAAGLEGAAFSRAQCYDLEQEIPYATIGNLVRGLLDKPGVSGTPPEALAEIALTIRDVRRRFPAIPVVEESQGEIARLRFTEAIQQMLENIAEEHPVILVIDDLHLVDDASLSVLHLIAHRVHNQAIMLVLVAREGELPRSPRAAQLRASGQTIGIQEIELPPLSDEESAELLEALLSPARSVVDAPLRRAMIRAAAGYPMILELLVQDWETNGDRSLALGLDAMTIEFATSADAPPVYKQVFERLAFALDHGTRHVLNVAAVLGHRLNDLSLYSVADLSQGQVMAAMADLVSHRVLRDGGGGLEFVNEFVRAAAYLGVPSPVRRALHTSVAAHLMDEERRGVRFLGLEIAWHATRAGRVAEVPSFLLKGAQEALAQGALDSAARALSTALGQLAPEDQCAATLLLAEVLQEQGRWGESATVLMDQEAARSSTMGTVLLMLAEHRTAASTGNTLVEALRRLLTIVEADSSQRVRLRAANAAAQLMGEVRDPTLARAVVSAVDNMSRTDFSEDERSQLDLCRTQLLYYSGEHQAVLEALTELANSMKARGATNSTLVRVYSGLGVIRCYDGQYDSASAEFYAARSLAVQIGNEAQQVTLSANLALCCLRLGKYGEQLEWSKKASGVGFSRYQCLQVAYNHAFALAMRGELKAAFEAFASVDPKIPMDSAPWLVQAWKLHRADILRLCGQLGSAMRQAREAIGWPEPTLHAHSFAGVFARWLALVSREEGALNGARVILDELGNRPSDFDAVDRAEIACARLIVYQSHRYETELRDLLAEHLADLPPAVVTHLNRLGALEIVTPELQTMSSMG